VQISNFPCFPLPAKFQGTRQLAGATPDAAIHVYHHDRPLSGDIQRFSRAGKLASGKD
jgi:hypothetical protein